MRNAPIVEFETDEKVSFQIIIENWSNNKNPKHPAVLERYNGREWKEVDRWDIKDYSTDGNSIKLKNKEKIIEEGKERINEKLRFNKDGNITNVNRRY